MGLPPEERALHQRVRCLPNPPAMAACQTCQMWTVQCVAPEVQQQQRGAASAALPDSSAHRCCSLMHSRHLTLSCQHCTDGRTQWYTSPPEESVLRP